MTKMGCYEHRAAAGLYCSVEMLETRSVLRVAPHVGQQSLNRQEARQNLAIAEHGATGQVPRTPLNCRSRGSDCTAEHDSQFPYMFARLPGSSMTRHSAFANRRNTASGSLRLQRPEYHQSPISTHFDHPLAGEAAGVWSTTKPSSIARALS